MSFSIGQKVCYIGPDFRSNPTVLHHGLIMPERGPVYTIRARAERSGGIGYLLNEIINKPVMTVLDGRCEIAIDASWLRPLIKQKTDISIFTALLDGVKQGEPA